MRELDVDVAADGHSLAATLALPDGEGPFPAALVLSGSGPIDRNSNHRRMRLGVAEQVARALTAAGVVTLRFDKRGVGGSDAGLGRNGWRRVGFHDNVDDAEAALRWLAARPEVDGGVVVVGHSEGAVQATALSARDVPLAGLVLLSGAAKPGEEVLLWQTRRIVPTLPRPVRAILRVLRVDVTRKVAANHAKIKATTTDVARIGGARTNARWFREYMAYDPRPDLERIGVPVLAITGSKDLQVDPGDLERIADLVRGPVETYLAPDVSHVLRRQPGPPSLGAYKREIRGPVDESVTTRVVEWFARVVQNAPGSSSSTSRISS